jgi:hypothetical protein
MLKSTTSTTKKTSPSTKEKMMNEQFTLVTKPQPISPDPRDADFPVIRNFFDVLSKGTELLAALGKHPNHDVIYHFPHLMTIQLGSSTGSQHLPDEFLNQTWNWCIAGSAALSRAHAMLNNAQESLSQRLNYIHTTKDLDRLIERLELHGIAARGLIERGQYLELARIMQVVITKPEIRDEMTAQWNKVKPVTPTQLAKCSFTPSDTDIFFLDSPANHRFIIPGIDLVHTKAKTVEELLINFDLPCCRVAFNSRSDYWISAQCLGSLLDGTYQLPTYVSNPTRFYAMLDQHRNYETTSVEKMLFSRMTQRIEKYIERGFTPRYVETDEVLPWIRNRFHYGVWKAEEEARKKAEEKKTIGTTVEKNQQIFDPKIGRWV